MFLSEYKTIELRLQFQNPNAVSNTTGGYDTLYCTMHPSIII